MRHALTKPAFLCCISLLTLSLSNARLMMVTIDIVIFISYLHPQYGGCMYLRMLPPILLTTRLHNPDYNDVNTAELLVRVIMSSDVERTERKR